jgi:hypothetical protein
MFYTPKFPDYVYFCRTRRGNFMTRPRSNWDIPEFKKGPLPKTKRDQSLRDGMERGQSPQAHENILTTGTKAEQYHGAMSARQENQSTPEPDRLEVATDEAIAACGGDARDAVRVLIVANEFLEAQVRELQAAVSHGYARGKFEPVPRDRKDWYD